MRVISFPTTMKIHDNRDKNSNNIQNNQSSSNCMCKIKNGPVIYNFCIIYPFLNN